MRSSAILLAALSALAIAAPVQKRAYVTDVVIEYETVYVTDGHLPTKTSVSFLLTFPYLDMGEWINSSDRTIVSESHRRSSS
jgi:hypothetical protein